MQEVQPETGLTMQSVSFRPEPFLLTRSSLLPALKCSITFLAVDIVVGHGLQLFSSSSTSAASNTQSILPTYVSFGCCPTNLLTLNVLISPSLNLIFRAYFFASSSNSSTCACSSGLSWFVVAIFPSHLLFCFYTGLALWIWQSLRIEQ